jgi:hypothetical protein
MNASLLLASISVIALEAAATAALADPAQDTQTQAAARLGQVATTDSNFNPLSNLQISASQANSTASLTVQSPVWSGFGTPVADHSDLPGDAFNFSLTASTPISKGADSANLASLSGLATSTNITFQLTGYHGSGFVPFGQFSAEGQAFCNSRLRYYETRYAAAFTKAYTVAKPFSPHDQGYCEQQDLDDLATALEAVMDDADKQALQTAYAKDQSAFQAYAHAAKPVILYGVTATAGYEAHTFFSSTMLAKTSEDKAPYQFGGYVTYVGASRNWAVSAQINYQSAYTDNPTKTLCPAGTAPVTCVTGAFGAPQHTDKALIAAEWRWFGQIFSLPTIGLDPMVTYDAVSGAYAFDLPIYLFNDGKNNLTGGVRVDWTSVRHDTVVGVFVSKAFSIGALSTPAT